MTYVAVVIPLSVTEIMPGLVGVIVNVVSAPAYFWIGRFGLTDKLEATVPDILYLVASTKVIFKVWSAWTLLIVYKTS